MKSTSRFKFVFSDHEQNEKNLEIFSFSFEASTTTEASIVPPTTKTPHVHATKERNWTYPTHKEMSFDLDANAAAAAYQQQFAFWDRNFIAAMEGMGYSVK